MCTIEENIDMITEIRGFNRFYTNLIGLLEKKLYNSEYSLSEARVIYEISKTEHCTAKNLCDSLNLDRGYMSRLITKFEKNDLIKRVINKNDNRKLEIQLTDKGKNLFHELELKANNQIAELITPLNKVQKNSMLKSMKEIKKNLIIASGQLKLRSYTKEDVDYVIERQLSLYESERHFTSDVWKRYVKEGVYDFVERYDSEKDYMFILEYNGNPAGCVAITHTEDDIAQLRYFFVEPELRGIGAGQMLIDNALKFCREKKYSYIFLWTVSAQETARRLYKNAGFKLTETEENDTWGIKVVEEKWDMDL